MPVCIGNIGEKHWREWKPRGFLESNSGRARARQSSVQQSLHSLAPRCKTGVSVKRRFARNLVPHLCGAGFFLLKNHQSSLSSLAQP